MQVVNEDPEVKQAAFDWRDCSLERWRDAKNKADPYALFGQVGSPLCMVYSVRFSIRFYSSERLVSGMPFMVSESLTWEKADAVGKTNVDSTIPDKFLAILRSDGKVGQVNDELKAKWAPRIRAILLELESAHGAAQLMKPILTDITYRMTLAMGIVFL